MNMTIIDKTYTILAKGEVHEFTTSLTEEEFYKTLDGVYGAENYKTLEIRYNNK